MSLLLGLFYSVLYLNLTSTVHRRHVTNVIVCSIYCNAYKSMFNHVMIVTVSLPFCVSVTLRNGRIWCSTRL